MTIVAAVLTVILRVSACAQFAELLVGVSGGFWDPTGTPSRWYDVLDESRDLEESASFCDGALLLLLFFIALLMRKEGLNSCG